MHADVSEVIAALKLAPLPGEGGFVRQTWRSDAGSAAYYLMTATEFSALHRLRAHEVWHFYAGDAVEHVTLQPETGAATATRLGANVGAGERPQLAVPGGVWQGARIAAVAGAAGSSTGLRAGLSTGLKAGLSTPLKAGWALVGCTLTPAWDERDCELGGREALVRDFPAAAEWIHALTRA